jgi:hypothetical protein
MGIIAIYTDQPGQINQPNIRRVKIITSDNLSTVTTAGYLNNASLQGYNIYNTDEIMIWYGATATPAGVTSPGTLGQFTASISNGVITLVAWVDSGNVLLPVTANHIAAFNGTTGQIYSDPATAINGGNIQAGLSGTAGTLASFPGTAANGSFIFKAINNSGGFNSTFSNSNIGQATVYSLPDPGAATANMIISASAGTQHITTGSLSVDAGNLLAGSSGNAGTLTSFPGTAANGSFIFAAINNSGGFNSTLSNSNIGQATVYSLPDPGAATANLILSASAGTQHITTGSLSVDVGNLLAGSSGHAGTVTSFPGTASNGSLILAAINNSGGFNSTISNSNIGQATVYSLPDPAAATANIVLDAGAQNVQTDHQIIVASSFQNTQFSTGTWTNTRIAQGDYGMVHTAAANTPIVGMNISAELRTAANKGYKLTSIGVISKIGTLALNSASATINTVAYANNAANVVAQLAFTGSLSTATQTNPYVDVLTLSAPIYNASNTGLVLEITYNCQATSALTFYGVILNFTRTLI